MGNDTALNLAVVVEMATSAWTDWMNGMVGPVLALTVVFAAMIVSYTQSLGIEKEMLIAIARAFLQLSVIGFVLEFIFSQSNVLWIFMAYLFMTPSLLNSYLRSVLFFSKILVDLPFKRLSKVLKHTQIQSGMPRVRHGVNVGYTAGRRAKDVPYGKYIAGVSILIGTLLTMMMLVLLKVFPFTPQYIIPVAGMMVGNAMTVTGVTLKRLREDLRLQQGLIETALALGATPRQAIMKQVRRALVVGLSPVLDNAKTVGLITLPGAMTGLIMGGASPQEAIQLQIVVMNMLLGASTFSGVLATYLSWPFFFTKTYQLQTKELRAE
ncbi:unnamed protein product [Calypogeia fissa]